MPITVQPELLAELTTEATVILQVRSTADPSLILAAMRASQPDLWELEGDQPDETGPKSISRPVPLPDGPAMMMDLGSTPLPAAQTIPSLLTRRLEDAGVHDAEIGLADRGPRAGRYHLISRFTPAARALLRLPLGDGRPEPQRWLLDIAAQWLHAEHHPEAQLSGTILAVDVPLTWRSIRPIMGPAFEADGFARMISTDLASSAATTTINNSDNAMSLTVAGARWSDAEVAERMRRQRDLIRGHAASLAWAGVMTETYPTWHSTRWQDPGPYQHVRPGQPNPRRHGVDMLRDFLVPDAMWYQVLSPGHLDRLGGPPPGAVPLTADRFEVTIGEPEQWLPDHADRYRVIERGRELLAGCLIPYNEAQVLSQERNRLHYRHSS
ncbi:hypothetical protein [Micromonospora sp. DT47]|uniref:hypothetical protein n=1 Tax=Micromonospora sp. DT47 TaxID=3393431 RepID=UPI003CF2C648